MKRRVLGIAHRATSKCFLAGITASTLCNFTKAQTESRHCAPVRGRYSIYADGDRLWIVGSKHLLTVVNTLDKELEKRGWETTVAYGTFLLCSARKIDAKQLTITDVVDLRNFSDIRFDHR